MNFNVDTTSSKFDQNAAFNEMYANRQSQRDNMRTDAPSNGGFMGFGGTDVVGLNAGEIANMKQAITTMCDNIKKEIEKMETEVDSTNAYKGGDLQGADIQGALKTYLTNVSAYCNNLTSNLKAFNDKLTDVENAWHTAITNMHEKISGNAGQFATGSEYQEQLQ